MTLTIVHVVCTSAFAGVERHIASLASRQAQEGDRVFVIGGAPTRMSRELRGVPWSPATSVLEARRALAATPAADIVNAHMTAAEIAVASVRRSGERRVATRHFARRRGSSPLAKAVSRLSSATFDGQIAVSHHVATHIEGPSRVVHPGSAVRADAARADERPPVILVAQRLEAEKETDVALRAFAKSALGQEGWRLQIAGTGTLETPLRHLAEDLGLASAVDFLGNVSDIDAAMDKASILLAPRSTEDFGLSVTEAMSGGLPVVAAAAAGHLETVGAVDDSHLFPPGDADAAGAALRLLASDGSLRDAYGRSLQLAQRQLFTLERQAAETRAFYEGLLE